MGGTHKREKGHGIDQSYESKVIQVYKFDLINSYNPDSETMALSSVLMYRKGLPTGGVGRSWMRDFTTSKG
jgi:hypothetical protein